MPQKEHYHGVAFWCTRLYGLSRRPGGDTQRKYIHHSCLPQLYVLMMLSYNFIWVYVSLSVTRTMPLIFENLMYVIIMSCGKSNNNINNKLVIITSSMHLTKLYNTTIIQLRINISYLSLLPLVMLLLSYTTKRSFQCHQTLSHRRLGAGNETVRQFELVVNIHLVLTTKLCNVCMFQWSSG